MASTSTINTTFIGDDILMRYQTFVLHRPSKLIYCPLLTRHRQHSGYAIDRQTLHIARRHLDLVASDGYKLHEKVVILLGTHDILQLGTDDGLDACNSMKSDINELIVRLWELNVKEIIVCTIPHITNLTQAAKYALQHYNEYLKSLPNAYTVNGTIKCVDLHAELSSNLMFEGQHYMPNNVGLDKIEEVLKPLL